MIKKNRVFVLSRLQKPPKTDIRVTGEKLPFNMFVKLHSSVEESKQINLNIQDFICRNSYQVYAVCDLTCFYFSIHKLHC